METLKEKCKFAEKSAETAPQCDDNSSNQSERQKKQNYMQDF